MGTQRAVNNFVLRGKGEANRYGSNQLVSIKLMKTFPILGVVAFSFCLTASGSFAAIVGLGNGLAGYWTFDETSGGLVHDSSGNGFNGTVVNYPGGQGNWTPGLFGGSLLFGGPTTHEYVSVPNFTMPTASMTLTAWVWANATPNWATIAANWNGAWGAFNYATFGSTPNMSLYVADGGSPPNIVNVDYGVSSTSLSLNQWHFLAFTADSQTHTATFMQDGVVTGSFNYSGELLASSSQLNIGDDPSDTSPGQGNWNGKIDDLAIWSRALSSQDLASIYSAGLSGQPLLTVVPEPAVTKFIIPVILLSVLSLRRKRFQP
jgi:Concanavalin A-like lectin/glucanases superfamily